MSADSITLDWAGITFGGEGSGFGVKTLDGWIGIPGAQRTATPSYGHGALPSPGKQDERLVTVGGTFRPDVLPRDAAIALLKATLIPQAVDDISTAPLTVTAAGAVGTGRAQLQRWWASTTDPRRWGTGYVDYLVSWLCPDPRIFAANTIGGTVGLLPAAPGPAMPRLMPFLMVEKPLSGLWQGFNPGTDPGGSPAVYTLVGEQLGAVGIENPNTGAHLEYAFDLGPSDVLVIDTELGAYLNGQYRPPMFGTSVTSKMRLAPGENTVRATGTPGAGTPTLTVEAQPAGW